MEGVGFGSAFLLSAELLIIVLFVFSEKLRRWADIVCCAMLGVFLHRLLSDSGRLSNDDWNIISACVFALSFSFIGWSALRKNLGQSELKISAESTDPLPAADVAVHDDRLRTLGLMNARLVHEMSHPLSTLNLRFEELKRNKLKGDQESIDKSFMIIQRQLNYLNHLNSSMRQYASDHRNQNGGFICLDDVFKLAYEFCELLAADLGVKIRWPKSTPEIDVSGGLTIQTQVMVNLLKNAIEAASGQTDESNKWVRVDLREKGGTVEISVSNGGPRLNRSVQGLLFKPFFSGKKTGQGMGIGLTLCRELVESIGGEIWYDAHAKNPTFVVRYTFLPRVSSETDDVKIQHLPFFEKAAS